MSFHYQKVLIKNEKEFNSIQNGLFYSVFVCTVYYVDAFKNCLKINFFP